MPLLAPIPLPSFLTKILVLEEVTLTPSITRVVAAPVAVKLLVVADQSGELGRTSVVANPTVIVKSSVVSRYPVTDV